MVVMFYDRNNIMTDFNKIFFPKSIAIVGASNREKSIGNSLVLNLKKDFKGKIYPVNLKEKKVAGLRAYASLSDIKDKVDLMLIAIPAKFVNNVLAEGGELGIKAAVVISAGFKEVGNTVLEEELKFVCKKYNITLIGPNCLGVLSPKHGLNASFSAQSAQVGQVAFVSQSGAICTAILDSANKLGIGFSKFVSIGNKAVVDELKLFDYLLKDKETKIIAMYVEQLNNSREFLASVKRLVAAGKPVIVLKAGKSQAGAKASVSHTGSLAGESLVYEALFRQAGVIQAQKIEEIFDFIKIFNNNEVKKTKHLAIITNAGGPAVIAVDAMEKTGLELAKLSAKTKIALKKNLAAAASVNNPIDILGDAQADSYETALKGAVADKRVDSILVILTPQSVTDIEKTAKVIIGYKKKTKKPLAVVFMGEELVAPARDIFNQSAIANYSFPESAVKSLAALNTFYQLTNKRTEEKKIIFKDLGKKKVEKIFSLAREEKRTSFNERQALEILKAYNFHVLPSYLATNKKEAIAIAKKINKTMVLKISSADILHKSDVGGIMLGVEPREAGRKFEEMIKTIKKNKAKAKIEGVLMVEMNKEPGLEMILGSFRDVALGQAIMLGLGGIYVEVFKDIAFGLKPLSLNDVQEMIDSLISSKLLTGVRGDKPKDRESLVQTILRLAKLLEDFPEIKELDINPILVKEQGRGLKVLDARIVIE